MSILVFENTAKKMSGKTGVNKPDATGYYQVVLGAFGIHNSAGNYYPANEVKELFTSSSELMNRINNGRCYGEWGHPKFGPGMTTREYLLKLLTIHEEQISHHIKKVELDESFKSPEGGTCCGVIGWVKPFGPKAQIVQQMLENPEQNACFSLRSISSDRTDNTGKVIKTPVKIITWDAVGEPGIDIADKYHNPSLESRYEFTKTDIVEAVALTNKPGIGLESIRLDVQDLAKRVGLVTKPNQNKISGRPKFLDWR